MQYSPIIIDMLSEATWLSITEWYKSLSLSM